jgi:hypothetical protein
LLGALVAARIDFVVIGGVAVGAHGVVRGTKDLDVCPALAAANIQRLAALLHDLEARQLGVAADDSAEQEMPLDPTRPDDLAAGGNFRLETPFGLLDLMQWIPGIEADQAYVHLAASAVPASAFGLQVMVCSLADLREMKRAAGRPRISRISPTWPRRIPRPAPETGRVRELFQRPLARSKPPLIFDRIYGASCVQPPSPARRSPGRSIAGPRPGRRRRSSSSARRGRR